MYKKHVKCSIGRPLLASVLAALALAASAPSALAETAPAVAASPASTAAVAVADGLKAAVDEAIRKVRPSLVRIFVVSASCQNGREVKYEAVGSGVIITPDGCVVTNHHVAGRARQIICTLADKEEVDADLVGTDPLADIAVIRLRGGDKRSFPAAKFGDSSKLVVGDRVLAMGSPLALSQSVTMGIVSNTEVIMPEFLPSRNQFLLEGEDVGSVVRWIGHDAQIFGGNSGGPLVNLDGEVVGINEIDIGLSGAIPGNLAREVAEEIIRTGKVRRSWFGLNIQPLLKREARKKGALVAGVVKGSPAEKAGFQPGDVLVSLGGKEVDVRFPEEVPLLNHMMMEVPVGDTVEAVAFRDGREVRLGMTSQEREYAVQKDVELPKWGMTARNLSLMDAKEMERDGQAGVIVTSVRAGGPCRDAVPKLSPGDVLTSLNGVVFKDAEELLRLTAELTKGKDSVPVLATFERGKDCYLTVVKLSDKDDPGRQGVDARKAWLAVEAQVVTKDMAAAMGRPELRGMRVCRVYPGGNAEKGGLKVGDVITSLDGEAVAPSSEDEIEVLDEMVRQRSVGSTAKLAVLRDGRPETVEVAMDQAPKSPKDMKKYTDKDFEFSVREVSFMDDVPSCGGGRATGGGVVVESVSEGGWASLARLNTGDLILSVDGVPVPDTATFKKEMRQAATDRRESLVFKVQRGIYTMFIEAEPEWPAAE